MKNVNDGHRIGWFLTTVAWLAVAVGSIDAQAESPTAPSRPSPLIFPRASIPLSFDHARHLQLGATCVGCHTGAATSTSSADDLMPGEVSCRPCHEIDRTQPFKVSGRRPAARCAACHVDWSGAASAAGAGVPKGAGAGADQSETAEPPRVVVPRPNLKFNHQLHVGRGIGCELCHAQVSTSTSAPGPASASGPASHPPIDSDLPRMALCLGCHTGAPKQPTARCGACHLTTPDGRLKVNLAAGGPITSAAGGKLMPSGALRGFDAHGPGFRTDHKAAGRDETYCLNCHRRSECLDCHDGAIRPLDIHPSDYVSLHGADGRRNSPDCSSCHRNQTFCVGCHQRTGVASDPAGGLPGHQPQNPFGTGTGVKSFHPPGWARDASGNLISMPTPASHSFQAKRNIRSCVSCHREETCLECHSTDPTRGANVNPHGVGFAESAKCRALSTRNRRACLKCHAVAAPELDCR